MALIIDGYNLLHVAGIFGRGPRGTSLQRSREALLRFLAASLPPNELARTTIVFDAAEAPPGLPHQVVHETMAIRYAANYEDADALIEELIAADHAPRSLLVVSSDHRIQRAARRRRAAFCDSDRWFADLLRRRQTRQQNAPLAARPSAPLSPAEVSLWLAEFAIEPETFFAPESPTPLPDTVSAEKPPGKIRDDQRMPRDQERPIGNPFPPGYAEDLLEDEPWRHGDRKE